MASTRLRSDVRLPFPSLCDTSAAPTKAANSTPRRPATESRCIRRHRAIPSSGGTGLRSDRRRTRKPRQTSPQAGAGGCSPLKRSSWPLSARSLVRELAARVRHVEPAATTVRCAHHEWLRSASRDLAAMDGRLYRKPRRPPTATTAVRAPACLSRQNLSNPHPPPPGQRPRRVGNPTSQATRSSAGSKQKPYPPTGSVSHRRATLVVMRTRCQRIGRRAQPPDYHYLVAALRNDGPTAWAGR